MLFPKYTFVLSYDLIMPRKAINLLCILNFWLSYVYLLSAVITGMCHHIQVLQWLVIICMASCMLVSILSIELHTSFQSPQNSHWNLNSAGIWWISSIHEWFETLWSRSHSRSWLQFPHMMGSENWKYKACKKSLITFLFSYCHQTQDAIF